MKYVNIVVEEMVLNPSLVDCPISICEYISKSWQDELSIKQASQIEKQAEKVLKQMESDFTKAVRSSQRALGRKMTIKSAKIVAKDFIHRMFKEAV